VVGLADLVIPDRSLVVRRLGCGGSRSRFLAGVPAWNDNAKALTEYPELLGFLREFGIGGGTTVEFFLTLVTLFVHHAGGSFHFDASLLSAAEAL
jgi:hypothetical protein